LKLTGEESLQQETVFLKHTSRMTRKTVSRLLAFAEACNQKSWRTDQADRVFELVLELAKLRDNKMLLRMRNRLGVENSNDC
jgi:HD superfamily phosphohydrolase